jgi:hypothetical protein
VTPALLLLVFVLFVASLVAGIATARQARRLLSARTPSVSTSSSEPATPAQGGAPTRQRPDLTVVHRPGPESPPPGAPAELVENDAEEEATYLAFTRAFEAHAKRADRKALYSNILFFAAGVLASILTTLLIHPL